VTREADLVVVGYGGAGATTALRATELGASVLLVEKQPADRHTPSTRMSGAHLMVANDVEKATRYLERCSGGMIPSAVSRVWAERAATVLDWLDRQGTDLRYKPAYGAEHPEFDGADGIDVCLQSVQRDGTEIEFHAPSNVAEAQGASWKGNPELRRGLELWTALHDAVARRPGVEILWESPAQRLVRSDDGRVAGVEVARPDGGTEVVHARHGVVLTTGGYEFDEQMKLNYLKAPGIHFYGNPGNTGDGVRMAQTVGADLWHMNQMIGGAIAHFELEDGTPVNVSMPMRDGVLTDKHGRRFMNEYHQIIGRHDVYYDLIEFDAETGEFPRIPCYWFFDGRLAAGPLVSVGAVEVGVYAWSADNSREIERGWVHVGDSVEEVAAKAGVLDPAEAARAVAAFNDACRAGGGDPLGRPPESLRPIEGPPFYCVPRYPGGANTCGGPRRNERAEVVDAFGAPIPGLYSAGELGEAIGLLYPAGGCNLSDAFCFGQIAAESALEAAPVSRTPNERTSAR
jgi:succinate dehydrogenase/fumarate reductase flavoprotein subunit